VSYSLKALSSGGVEPLIRVTGTIKFTQGIVHQDFMGGSPVHIASWIAIFQYAVSRQAKEQCVTTGVRGVDRWHTLSRFHGEKFQNNRIRICDIANPEVSMRLRTVE
jgi:hypothetical protein